VPMIPTHDHVIENSRGGVLPCIPLEQNHVGNLCKNRKSDPKLPLKIAMTPFESELGSSPSRQNSNCHTSGRVS
jgi:hypothetical protein